MTARVLAWNAGRSESSLSAEGLPMLLHATDDRVVILPHPALRIETDELGFQPGDVITLATWYRRILLPELQDDLSPRSIDEDWVALRHWERYTRNPDIRDVTSADVRQFRDGLLSGRSKFTVNKNWRELRPMFRVACDEGIIDRMPQVSRIRRSTLVCQPSAVLQPDPLTDDQVARICASCQTATYPRVRGYPAPLMWHCAVVLLYFYGMRTRDCWTLDKSGVSYTQKLVTFEAMKTHKLQGLPMPPIVERWLRELMATGSPGGRVLPGFNTPGARLTRGARAGTWKRGYYSTWGNEILPAAGFPDDGEDRVLIKRFRQTMVTRYEEIDKGLGGWIAGHFDGSTTEKNYNKPSRRIRAAINSSTNPSCFDFIE